MLVKATISLVGKRELTGQQTASFLLGRRNHYTSEEFQEYWWSSMLRDLAREVFVVELNPDYLQIPLLQNRVTNMNMNPMIQRKCKA
jgi:hypothetical protein